MYIRSYKFIVDFDSLGFKILSDSRQLVQLQHWATFLQHNHANTISFHQSVVFSHHRSYTTLQLSLPSPEGT